MAQIFCFLELNNFVSNSANNTNPIGELSSTGETYDRDVHKYYGASSVLNEFNTIATPKELTSAEGVIQSLLPILDKFTTVYPTLTSDNLSNLLAIFGSAMNTIVTNLTTGVWTLNPLDNKVFPSWIQFNYLYDTNTYTFKIWLSNIAFEAEYPYGEITPIGPIDNYSGLFTNFASTAAAINAVKMNTLLSRYKTTISWPDTSFSNIELIAYNPNNTSDYVTIQFIVSYNGGAVYCNEKAFLESIISYLMATSPNYTRDQWITLIPALSPVDKLYVIPNWNNTSISNVSLAAPICSPTVRLKDLFTKVSDFINTNMGPTLSATIDYLSYTTVAYKSLGLFVIPIANDAGTIKAIDDIYPDYFVSLLGDINVNQMHADTQAFVVTLDQTIRLAEAYKLNDPLPPNFTLETYQPLTFIKTRTLGVEISVLVRISAQTF